MADFSYKTVADDDDECDVYIERSVALGSEAFHTGRSGADVKFVIPSGFEMTLVGWPYESILKLAKDLTSCVKQFQKDDQRLRGRKRGE